jgi:hypothetical protein
LWFLIVAYVGGRFYEYETIVYDRLNLRRHLI